MGSDTDKNIHIEVYERPGINEIIQLIDDYGTATAEAEEVYNYRLVIDAVAGRFDRETLETTDAYLNSLHKEEMESHMRPYEIRAEIIKRLEALANRAGN